MTLYAHQEKIIAADPKKCGIFLGTGSGKSRICLMLARGDILVICPKTQKQDQNWEREYRAVLEESVKKYGRGETPKLLKPRLTVISKEEFRRDAAFLPHYETVIVDEAHTCLGVLPNTRQRHRVIIPKASQLFDALQAYVERTKPTRLYLCTATIMKSPMTVWAAGKILGREWDFYEFRSTFYSRLPIPMREVWQSKSDKRTKEALAEIVKNLGSVGRLEDYFDVPEQTFRNEYVSLTEKQKKRIKDMRLDFPEPIVRIGKINQIENGILSGDEFNAPELFENAKIDRILELATEFPKMVIFCKYRAQIEQIQQALTTAKIHTWTLTGDTKDRGAVIKQANELDGVFLAQSQISAGWELPAYPVMVFASMSYSFVDRVQAEGRILRANHLKKNLYITLIVKGGVDEAIFKAISNKKDFDEKLYLDV